MIELLPAVISLTVSDPDAQVRKKAASALARIDEEGAVEQLVAAVCTSNDFASSAAVQLSPLPIWVNAHANGLLV